MYKDTNLENGFTGLEKDVLEFWKKNNIIKKNLNMNKDKKPFTFYDGPPTANGMPHAGHILTRVIKDVIPRYKIMKGYNVDRKAGWDTHGLPVELEIEKQIGISGKEQIEEFGVEKFNKLCKESVFKYVNIWEEMTEKVGFWVDMDDPYITYKDEYIESVWWALKELFNKGLLYEGHKVMPYCPRCGTALSSHEVGQGYKDVKDLTATVMFKVEGEDRYLLAWTTTPWTLPSNIAVGINKKYEYADVKVDLNSKENNRRIKNNRQKEKEKAKDVSKLELLDKDYRVLVIAKDLVERELEGYDYEVLKTYPGEELLGLKYERLLDFGKVEGKSFEVIHGDFVNLTDGTGLVHLAPAFGEDDSLACKENNMAFINLVDAEGKFVDEVEPWKHRFVRDTNVDICDYLDVEGKLFKSEYQEHAYPHCWRCDTPLLYYPKKSWFVKMSSLRNELMENNSKVNWYPESIGKGRFGNFLENVIDWSISRDRYWGTPLPIWKCTNIKCNHVECIGSKRELLEKSINNIKDIELHKPYVDEVKIKCPICGEEMVREPEVIDCWFDSGSMPFAQHHYPFESKDKFKNAFPADFISEAIDQTRGWFYTLMALSTSLFGDKPYNNVIVLGHVLDGKGQKMSKSKKNGVDPLVLLNEVGADATRWYFFNGSQPWISSRLSIENVEESQRGFLHTLYNAYSFYVLYANIDGFDYTKYDMDMEYTDVMDKWIVSKANTLILDVDDRLASYDINGATKYIANFTDELSNWYIRRNRKRFWTKGMEEDKISCYMALYTSLRILLQVAAPFVPFITEAIYQNIVRSVDKDAKESIHLNLWPEYNEKRVDKNLESEMEIAYEVVKLGRNIRNSENIKNRQPLSKMLISESLPEYYTNIIKEELNVKEIELGANMDDYVIYDVKPNLPVLGKKYGKLIPSIRKELDSMDQTELANTLARGDSITLEISGEEVVISDETAFATMEGKEGYAFSTNGTIGVVIDTEITEELKKEGYLRELLSKIQNTRKENNFEVVDRIELTVVSDDYILNVVADNEENIKRSVLAKGITTMNEKDLDEKEKNKYTKININDKDAYIFIQKA